MHTTQIQPKYVDLKTVVIKEHVKQGQMVHFEYFRDEGFWYRTDKGLLFPISLKEASSGRATFLAHDKAIYFMRWIKRYVAACKQEAAETEAEDLKVDTA
jgi:hypothetical protein